MNVTGIGYRDRSMLPRLGATTPASAVVLDSNVFINALAARGPPELQTLLANLPTSFVAGPTLAELSWTNGRLDPAHPDTATVLAKYKGAVGQIDPAKMLVPTPGQWMHAGELAGHAARAVAGPAKSIKTAFDRIELINDAVTAIVARDAGLTIITCDGDFDLFMQLDPSIGVLFYDLPTKRTVVAAAP